MKINHISFNNRKKAFELSINGKPMLFPYVKLRLKPTVDNYIVKVFIDPELGNEAFTYTLRDGREDSVHLDVVLEYNRDPNYLRDLLLYKLTIMAQKCLKTSDLPRREIIRRLDTSASQFYRLLDQTNYKKSVDQVLALLNVLGCELDLVEKQKKTYKKAS